MIFALIFVVLVIGVIGFYLGNFLIGFGLSPLLAYLLGILLFLVLVILIAVIISKDFRAQLPAVVRLLLRISERIDFRAAQKASGSAGQTFELDQITVWTDDAGDWEEELQKTVATTIGEFSKLTGFPEEMSVPVRLLCFEQDESFTAYCQPVHPGTQPKQIAGFHQAGRVYQKRIVINQEMATRINHTFQGVFSHELVHHLIWSNFQSRRSPWLEEGLSSFLAESIREEVSAAGTRTRFSKPNRHVAIFSAVRNYWELRTCSFGTL